MPYLAIPIEAGSVAGNRRWTVGIMHVVLQALSLEKRRHLKTRSPLWATAVLDMELDSAGTQLLLQVCAIRGVDCVCWQVRSVG